MSDEDDRIDVQFPREVIGEMAIVMTKDGIEVAGMRELRAALDRLCDPASYVDSHGGRGALLVGCCVRCYVIDVLETFDRERAL